MSRVEDKIRKVLGDQPQPYFFPLHNNSTPKFPSKCILAAFSATREDDYKLLPYDYPNTIIMVESGGWSGNPKNAYDCLRRQSLISPDLALTFDEPTKSKPKQVNYSEEEMMARVRRTIENAKLAKEIVEDLSSKYELEFELVAVIQAVIDYRGRPYLKSLISCTESLYELGFDFFAFGRRNALTIVLGDYINIRQIIGKKAWLHALGTTDVTILKAIKPYIDSFDSAYVTRQASYGNLILPDGTTIYVGDDPSRKPSIPYRNRFLLRDGRLNYQKLQLANYRNYVERLNRFVYSVRFR